MKPKDLLVVEDSAVFARGLEATLSTGGQFVMIGSAATRVEASRSAIGS